MEKYVALLRGINVGGKNIIKMDDLKKTFEQMDFSDVQTYIASGNVIFKSSGKNQTILTKLIEKKLTDKYKCDLRIVLVNFKNLKKIIEEAPGDFETESKTHRYDVWFLMEPLKAKEVLSQVKPREGVDTINGGKGVVYTSRLNAMLGKSWFSKIIQLPIYQNITIRSWNTAVKLFGMMNLA